LHASTQSSLLSLLAKPETQHLVKKRFSSKLKTFFKADPARGEEQLSAMFDEMNSPESLEKLSTHGPISEEQRKKIKLDEDLIRAIIVRAKKSTRLSPFTDNLLEKFKSAATKVFEAAFLNPENVAIIKDQLKSDTSVLSDSVGKLAREDALAAMLSMRLQKRRLRKRSPGTGFSTPADADDAGDIEMGSGTNVIASGLAADYGQSDAIETATADIERGCDSAALPDCPICLQSFTNPVVYLLKL
jgi:hypothetical protein